MAENKPAGVLGSLKGWAATLVDVAHTRLEILSTEVEEEKLRIAQMLLFAVAALFFLGLGIVFAAIFVTVLFGDAYRLPVLGALTLLFLAAGAGAVRLLQGKAREKSRLFTDSLGELAKDRSRLRS
ncbi:MAG: phage holin family protein [Sulfuricellaceae bacterium]